MQQTAFLRSKAPRAYLEEPWLHDLDVTFHKYHSLTWGRNGTWNSIMQRYMQGFGKREVGKINIIKKGYHGFCLQNVFHFFTQIVAWVKVNSKAANWISQVSPSHWWVGHKYKWRLSPWALSHVMRASCPHVQPLFSRLLMIYFLEPKAWQLKNVNAKQC